MTFTGTTLLILAVVLGIILLSKPMQTMLKALLRGALGAVGLVALSAFGGGLGMTVGVNAVTLMTAAVLGLPGLTALALISLFI